MSKLSVGSIQRTARIASLILGIIPILVPLGFTIHLLIVKYYAWPHNGLTWLEIEGAFGGQLLPGLVLGGPLLIARFVAERKPLVGAIIMLILGILFIFMQLIALDRDQWTSCYWINIHSPCYSIFGILAGGAGFSIYGYLRQGLGSQQPELH